MNANADRCVEWISCQCYTSKERKKPTFRAKRAPHCYTRLNEKSEMSLFALSNAQSHARFFLSLSYYILMLNFCMSTIFFFFVIESKLLDQKPHLVGLVVVMVMALALVVFVIGSNKKIPFTITINRTSYIFDEHIPWFPDPNFRLCVFVELTMSFYHHSRDCKGFMCHYVCSKRVIERTSSSYIWKLIGIQIIIIDTNECVCNTRFDLFAYRYNGL